MTFSSICLIAALLLLPIIPATLVYRLSPDMPIAASGFFSGLSINAGGAFAGYFALVLIISPFVYTTWRDINRPTQRYLTVKGTIKLIDPQPQPQQKPTVHSPDRLGDLRFETDPRTFHKVNNKITLNIPKNSRGTEPLIILEIHKWGKTDVDLNAAKWRKRIRKRKIERIRALYDLSSSQQSVIHRLLELWMMFSEADGVVDVGEVEIRKRLHPLVYSAGADIDRPTR